MQAAGNDDAVVRRQDGIAGEHMGLRLRMGTALTGQGEGAEATDDGDTLVALTVDQLRGKKPGGAGPSVRRR
jgi:hypothetical protein